MLPKLKVSGNNVDIIGYQDDGSEDKVGAAP